LAGFFAAFFEKQSTIYDVFKFQRMMFERLLSAVFSAAWGCGFTA
jgi:hypothetical protein